MVSGLHVASAVLAKYKPEGAEKPVLRPYTPISDEGTSLSLSRFSQLILFLWRVHETVKRQKRQKN